MTFNEIIERYKRTAGDMSNARIAERLGWSTATFSLVLNGKYTGDMEEKTRIAESLLLGEGSIGTAEKESVGKDFIPIEIKQGVTISTPDFNATYQLCNGLLDPVSSLTASIGMITGLAGRGKTTAVRSFAAENEGVVYVLYMGYSRAALFKVIAEELTGRSVGTYAGNLQLIMEATRAYRKLIIIDEADRVPLRMLEDLRTLNEAGAVPLLLVGEPMLASMARKADRIESRIRKPKLEFRPLDYVTLATLYKESCGLSITKAVAERLIKMSNADFRVAANDMQNIVRLMNINHYSELTERVLNEFKRI